VEGLPGADLLQVSTPEATVVQISVASAIITPVTVEAQADITNTDGPETEIIHGWNN
jgi:hypothetical protein